MSEKPPSARELLDEIGDPGHCIGSETSHRRACLVPHLLAARVEAALALTEVRHASEAYDAALRAVRALLDGLEP
jgi:hypothetical protein